MTFFRRGMMCVWQCSPSSTMIQRRPILWATAPVVPGAGEGVENPVAPIGREVEESLRRASGFGVSKALVLRRALFHLRCRSLWPAFVRPPGSERRHHSFASERSNALVREFVSHP